MSVLGVKPRPSDSTVASARGGFGGLTDSGEPGFLELGDDGDVRSASAVHVLHQCSLVLNVTLSPGSNLRLFTVAQAILQHINKHTCCTALHPAASRYCSERRTMQLGSSSRLHDVLMPGHYCGTCTGCPFNTESSTRSLC